MRIQVMVPLGPELPFLASEELMHRAHPTWLADLSEIPWHKTMPKPVRCIWSRGPQIHLGFPS